MGASPGPAGWKSARVAVALAGMIGVSVGSFVLTGSAAVAAVPTFPTPTVIQGGSGTLLAVSCSDSENCTAVGDGDTGIGGPPSSATEKDGIWGPSRTRQSRVSSRE